jgi:hypothetical protein
LITAAIGALMGVFFGAIVGRVIALFGDKTIETKVPMIFCGTLGYFVGGASTIKGSLERFNAKRAPLATFVATVILVVLVGGASVTAQAGVLVAVAAVLALVLASVAAVAVGKPDAAPKHGLNAPRNATPKAPQAAKVPKAPKETEAPAPELDVDDWMPDDEPTRPRAAEAARRVDTTPPLRPRPLVPPIDDAPSDASPESMAPDDPSPTGRPRRERPLGRADLTPRPAAKKAPVTKKGAPMKKAAPAAKKAAPAAKKAAPAAKKAAPAAKKAVAKKASAPTIKKAPAPRPQRERPLRRDDA